MIHLQDIVNGMDRLLRILRFGEVKMFFDKAYLVEVMSGCATVKNYCSKCKQSLPHKIGTKYCPSCGRKFVDTKVERLN